MRAVDMQPGQQELKGFGRSWFASPEVIWMPWYGVPSVSKRATR